jgi:ATPase subunit of ABC transporter with duplicated ATPase domains
MFLLYDELDVIGELCKYVSECVCYADSLFRPGGALEQALTTKGSLSSPHVNIESLDSKKPLPDMTEAEFLELTKQVIDGPAKVDFIMELLGLTRTKGTWVGNQMFRGISGGERKRLSTAEHLMGSQSVFLLDEISTGLVRTLVAF